MDRLISWTMTLTVLLLVAMAGFGVQYNTRARIDDMPVGINYMINANKNIWPDNFYVGTYVSTDSRSFTLDGYWTFEHASHPFGGPVWLYHTNQLTITDSGFAVTTIVRK